jgi:hypothetical protein
MPAYVVQAHSKQPDAEGGQDRQIKRKGHVVSTVHGPVEQSLRRQHNCQLPMASEKSIFMNCAGASFCFAGKCFFKSAKESRRHRQTWVVG